MSAATPGTPLPWEAHQGVLEHSPSVWDITAKSDGWAASDATPQGWFLATVHETKDAESARLDAAYIVEACNAYPDLLALVKKMARALGGLADVVEHDCDCPPCIGSMAPGEHFLGLARATLTEATAIMGGTDAL